MIEFLVMMFILGGVFLLVVPSYLEMTGSLILTAQQSFMLSFLGALILIVPSMLLLILAKRTSAIHLIDFPKRGQVLWLYILKGGYAYFTPSTRLAQAHLWSKGKGIVKDIGGRSRITIGRHDCRIVLETVGHTIDPYYAHYTSLLKKKYGVQNFLQARNLARFIDQGHVSEERIKERMKKKGDYVDQEDFTDEEVEKILGIKKKKKGDKK